MLRRSYVVPSTIRPREGGKNGATHPPVLSPQLVPAPDTPPRAADAAQRAPARGTARRIVAFTVVVAILLLGLISYFAYARSVVPLRVGD